MVEKLSINFSFSLEVLLSKIYPLEIQSQLLQPHRYTSNNMFDGMAVEAAPPAPALGGSAVVSATATCPTSAGRSAPQTVELSLFNPNTPEFHPGGLVSSLHKR